MAKTKTTAAKAANKPKPGTKAQPKAAPKSAPVTKAAKVTQVKNDQASLLPAVEQGSETTAENTTENATTENTTTAVVYGVGDIAKFTGYSELAAGEDEVLSKGEHVRIVEVKSDDEYIVEPIALGQNGTQRTAETLFGEELELVQRFDPADPIARQQAEDQLERQAADAPDTPAKIGKIKKIAAVTTTAVAPAAEVLEITHSSSVSAILQEHDALAAARELVSRVEESEFTLGGVLAVIHRDGLYQRLGYDGKRGFEDYAEKELGVKYRKARYLIATYEYFTSLGVDETKLAAIGWSKAKELVGRATAENFDELVEFAKNNTRDKLIEHLRTSTVSAEAGDGATSRKTVMKFVLFDDQSTTVGNAIGLAKTAVGSDDPNTALEHICGEWMQLSANVERTLEDEVRSLEARYGVTLQVVVVEEVERQAA